MRDGAQEQSRTLAEGRRRALSGETNEDEEWQTPLASGIALRQTRWPREESNLRTQIRSLPLYPLSYGARPQSRVACAVQ